MKKNQTEQEEQLIREILDERWAWLSNRIDIVLRCYQSRDKLPSYHRNLLIKTTCEKAELHNYQEMKGLLETLCLNYPQDAHMVSLGQSKGYGDDSNALDILSLQIPAKAKPKHTVFFVSGHHYCETSGPETVYEIAKRILESDSDNNQYIKAIRELTTFIFIPQVDVDAYNNLEIALRTTEIKFGEQAYSRFLNPVIDPEILEINQTAIRYFDNAYFKDEIENKDENIQYSDDYVRLFYMPPSMVVSKAISDIRYGKPFLACDFHEQRIPKELEKEFVNIDFIILSERDTPLPRYVYEEVAKDYPVSLEHSLNPQRIPEEGGKTTFSEFLANLGASSYAFEPPGNISPFNLAERIEMNLIATDRILSKHYLGI